MPSRKPEESRILHRSTTLKRGDVDQESRTVSLAFSSETDQVERWFGIEILDHGRQSIRLGRLQNAAPLLVDHNPSDQIGVVESVSVDADRMARAVVRFGKGAHATEIFNDVVDGIRSKVSVGYMIHAREETDEGTEHKPVYRVTDWEPYEISIVSVPADDSVGIGRDAEQIQTKLNQERTMPETIESAAPAATAPPAPAVDLDKLRADERKAEQKRQNEIRAIAKRRGMEDAAESYLSEGRSVDDFRAYVVDHLDDTAARSPTRHADVDLSSQETRSYSVLRAIEAASSGDWSGAGLEREVSDEIGKQFGRTTSGVYIPTSLRNTPEMMARMAEIGMRAPLEATTDASGGYTVQTNVMTLIDMLRNKMLVRRMGAQVLGGLKGDLSFPAQATGSAFSWVAETPGSDLADSDATFGQVTMAPKTGQSTTGYSKQLLAQSSLDVEMFVRNDLTLAAAIGIDLAAIAGTGASNQPTGILNTAGIGDVAGGTNGLAPTWDHIVDIETEVAIDNADIGTLGYLTNAKVRGKLKKTFVDAGSGERVWGKGMEAGFGELNGYRAGVTNQVPSDLDKGTSTGVCSAIIFGNWADLLIGEWGAMEILVDPYSKKKQGLIEVTSFCMADIAVRHAESFAAMQDALTA